MKKFFVPLIILTSMISCQKEVQGDVPSVNTSDYQPVTAGSEWNYSSTLEGDYKRTAVGTDTLINGRRFYAFDRTATGQRVREYISKINGVYRSYAEFAPAAQVVDLIYLKDSAVGTSWTNTISVNGFNNYHKYTIIAKDIQRTVNGTTYSHVIELNYEFTLDNPIGVGQVNAGGGKQFYAKDVGPIESLFTVGFMGFNVSDTTRLVNYSIR